MDRLFKTRTFNRWNKEELTDQALCNAVAEMKQGLIDANLGGHVFKNVLLCTLKESAAEQEH